MSHGKLRYISFNYCYHYYYYHNFHRTFDQVKVDFYFPIFRKNGASLELFNIVFEKKLHQKDFFGEIKKKFEFF